MLWTSPGVRLPGEKPRVQLGSLSGIWAFSLGMTGITVTGMILTQVDKLVLTKLLPLDQFGYYSLATSAASLLPQLVAPLFVAVFPMLSQALVGGNQDEVRGQFHLSAQLTALVVFPAAVTLVLFAQDVLTVWTGDPAMAQTSARALSLLALGALLNSVWAMPYTLQLATQADRQRRRCQRLGARHAQVGERGCRGHQVHGQACGQQHQHDRRRRHDLCQQRSDHRQDHGRGVRQGRQGRGHYR
jgi:hypothetical protein